MVLCDQFGLTFQCTKKDSTTTRRNGREMLFDSYLFFIAEYAERLPAFCGKLLEIASWNIQHSLYEYKGHRMWNGRADLLRGPK